MRPHFWRFAALARANDQKIGPQPPFWHLTGAGASRRQKCGLVRLTALTALTAPTSLTALTSLTVGARPT